MFDFSLGEMLVVGTVALVVIGPERLPKVARTVGALLARAQRYVNNVKADIQREVELDNLKRLEAEMQDAGRQIMSDIKSGVDDIHATLGDAAREVQAAAARPAVPAVPPADAAPPQPGHLPTPDQDGQQLDLFAAPQADARPALQAAHDAPARPDKDRR